jgi:putative hydrolase of the HAD superfamily
MIRAVLFDWGGVLLHRRLKPTLARWDDKLQLAPDSFLTALYRGTDETVLVGKIDAEQHWLTVCRALGLTEDQHRQVRRELAEAERFNSRLGAFVSGLRPRYKTALVANLWSDGREECRRHGVEALFDEIVISAEVGVAKPDPAIIQIALDRLGVTAAQSVFVDDGEENVAAASALGLRTVLFTNRREAVAAIEALLGGRAPG